MTNIKKNKSKKNICVVTGSRAEYGLLKPIMIAIKRNPKLRLQLIVTGMHLIPEFGYTVKEIKKDGFKIDAQVDMMIASDALSAMSKSVGVGIIGVTQALEKLKPDILLVLGDRIEILASVIAASIMNIPIAHIGGGHNTGCIDNSIRQAITKFAHIHLTTTPLCAKRIRETGEEKQRIHIVGHVFLDVIKDKKLIPTSVIADKYSLNLNWPILLVIFHSNTLDVDNSISQAKYLCQALVELKQQTILIYPNADAGSRRILEIIKKYSIHPKIQVYKNLPQIDYYSIMKLSSVMLGNSSSGLTEAPVFNLPVVNIGDRQKGRYRQENVINIAGRKEEIIKIANKILTNRGYRNKLKNCLAVYGDGKTGERIAKILTKIQISNKLIFKTIL